MQIDDSAAHSRHQHRSASRKRSMITSSHRKLSNRPRRQKRELLEKHARQAANRSNPSGSPAQTETKAEQQRGELAKTDESKQQQSQKRRQEQVSGKDHRKTDSLDSKSIDSNANSAKAAAGEPDRAANQKPNDQKPGETAPAEPNANAQKPADQSERKADGQPTADLPAGSVEALKAVPDSLVQQSAKALPKMSAELLKKAAQLRARELSPADIERLRKAAESLARDLAKIEQSKELQKALEEMARQTDPQQIEQVARELGNQEDLKQELEAAGRLLSENQQAKEMVAGLDGQLARMQEQRRQRGDNSRGTSKANVGGEESGRREPSFAEQPRRRIRENDGGSKNHWGGARIGSEGYASAGFGRRILVPAIEGWRRRGPRALFFGVSAVSQGGRADGAAEPGSSQFTIGRSQVFQRDQSRCETTVILDRFRQA